MGGIKAAGLSSVTFQFDGHLIFSNNTDEWPTDENGDVLECIYMYNISNVTFTSSKKDMKGVLDGNGLKWWGIPGLGYLRHTENRPRLLNIESSSNILVENILFLNSPYWTFWVHDVDGLEVRFSEISARRTDIDYHDLVDMTAFNTDGFDVTGRNVWIHDCEVWTQDDTIAVKDGSENMLFERITASGVGLTIGSIGSSSVRNITFRDCYMPNTYKGIYLKFRDGDGGLIEDVTFENIVIDEPTQWPIWIGPAQQSDSRRLCAAHPCSICWPFLPSAECNAPLSQYRNILLKNITINSPKLSPGVIFANPETPMDGVVFEDVVFNAPGENPWNDAYYYCDGVKGGVAKGTTWPVPPCFEDQTTRTL
ncbi:pgaC [Symbiodinium microadriaticum]|nr:pgaC [Symbiodinium microadriaticum]